MVPGPVEPMCLTVTSQSRATVMWQREYPVDQHRYRWVLEACAARNPALDDPSYYQAGRMGGKGFYFQ